MNLLNDLFSCQLYRKWRHISIAKITRKLFAIYNWDVPEFRSPPFQAANRLSVGLQATGVCDRAARCQKAGKISLRNDRYKLYDTLASYSYKPCKFISHFIYSAVSVLTVKKNVLGRHLMTSRNVDSFARASLLSNTEKGSTKSCEVKKSIDIVFKATIIN